MIWVAFVTKNKRQAVSGVVVRDFKDVDLGDERRNLRTIASVAALASDPRRTFPQVFRDEAAREGFYRLLRNPAVDPEAILLPHVEASVERAAASRSVVIAHDESELLFKGEKRQGLGDLSNGSRGLYIRGSLVVDIADELRPVLGVVRMERYVFKKGRHPASSSSTLRARKKPESEKETDWWRRAALETSELLATHPDVIHVMDREADTYALMAALAEGQCRFVIRARHNRVIDDELKLKDVVWKERGESFRQVPLSRRRLINRRGAHPARDERNAKLSIRSVSVTIPRPEASKSEVAELSLNVVHVYEPRPPRGEAAIEWLLLTTEPVETKEQMTRVVDAYRARWRIEEYFKALKTGCDVESRQLESIETLSNALAIFVPIAWALLNLRNSAHGDAPASLMFSADQLQLMRALCPEAKLSKAPSLRAAMLVIASLGGLIKSNGEPGWAVLGRGFQDFVSAERGWRAARGQEK